MKASADLIAAWQTEPEAEVSVIVHVDGPADQHEVRLADLGLTVERVFRLTNTIAGRGLACQVLDLLDQTWVKHVELDRQITTMG